MIHAEFSGAKRDYMGSGWKYEIAGQTQMLKRKYPDYKKGDYVLWIVPDIWLPFMSDRDKDIHASMEIIQGGKRVPVDTKIRKPYPNKGIFQQAMKHGRGSMYGVPLVFHSFEELATVTGVHIIWQLKLGTNVSVTDVTYDFLFEKGEGKYMYTVAMKDNSPLLYSCKEESYRKIVDEWRKEFRKETTVTYTQKERKTEIRESKESKLCSVETLTGITGLSRINDYLMDGCKAEEGNTYFIFRMRTPETLRPTEIAEITAEPSFGFDNITPEELSRYESFF